MKSSHFSLYNIFGEKCCHKLQSKFLSSEVFNRRKYNYLFAHSYSRATVPRPTLCNSPECHHFVILPFFLHFCDQEPRGCACIYCTLTVVPSILVWYRASLPLSLSLALSASFLCCALHVSCILNHTRTLYFPTIDGFYQILCISYVEQLCKTSFSNCFPNRFPPDNVTRHY